MLHSTINTQLHKKVHIFRIILFYTSLLLNAIVPFSLGCWLTNQRRSRKTGGLKPERQDILFLRVFIFFLPSYIIDLFYIMVNGQYMFTFVIYFREAQLQKLVDQGILLTHHLISLSLYILYVYL